MPAMKKELQNAKTPFLAHDTILVHSLSPESCGNDRAIFSGRSRRTHARVRAAGALWSLVG